MATLMSGLGGTPEELQRRMMEISGRHSELDPPTTPQDSSVAASKPSVRFSEVAAPAKNAAAEGPSEKPAFVTPGQQNRDVKMGPASDTEHRGVAVNLEEQARMKEDEEGRKGGEAEETIDPKVRKAMNNPPETEDVEGGTPV